MDQGYIDVINRQLFDAYGRLENQVTWRIVWSEDQREHRYGTYRDYTPEGFLIREVTESREVPKYSQWAPECWMLERLLVVPPDPNPDHPELDGMLSYEPMWQFTED